MPFGVGCLHFAYAEASRGTTVRSWADLVEKTLLSIPSVADVSVECGENPDQAWDQAASDDGNDSLYSDSFPNPSGAIIRFTITIPRRMHSSFVEGLGRQSERFEVITEYGYEAPVTFVYALDVLGQRGSSGLILVREFLRQEVARRTDELVLRMLGPSPFHVDFVLAGIDNSESWSIERDSRPGYDLLIYGYPTSDYEAIDDARDVMMRDLVDEFSLFYELQLRRNRRRQDADGLAAESSALIGVHQRRGVRGLFKRLFWSGQAARSLGISALMAKVNSEEDAAYARPLIDDMYSGSRPLAQNENKLRNVSSEDHDPEIRNALEIVSFLEDGRSKEFEVAVLTAATVLGALAGAGASLLAR